MYFRTFLIDSLKGKLDEPAVDDLIEIFQIYSRGSIKRYLFKSIKKKPPELRANYFYCSGPDLQRDQSCEVNRTSYESSNSQTMGRKLSCVMSSKTQRKHRYQSKTFHETIFRLTDTSGNHPRKSSQSVVDIIIIISDFD